MCGERRNSYPRKGMQQTSTEESQEQARLGRKCDQLGIGQKPIFDHIFRWYVHKPVSVQENKTCKILWDFEIQTDRLIPARRRK